MRLSQSLRVLSVVTAAFALFACSPAPEESGAASTDAPPSADAVAERYVRLALSARHHDGAFVDAYFGPDDWDAEAQADTRSIDELRAAARELEQEALGLVGDDAQSAWRVAWLQANLRAMVARLDYIGGVRTSFDEEALALFGVTPPRYEQPHFERLIAELDSLLPTADGLDLRERYHQYRDRFVIPGEQLDAVFRASIDACRARTSEVMSLPEGETFTLEYVNDKPWSGYNWYQGGALSLIQVNTDLPIHIDRAVDLACHEGYPGHHTLNALIEQRLVNELGYMEFSLYPLFSPLSLIAEGSANLGIEMAFPGDERERFESEVLFPMAGLDPAEADRYYAVQTLVEELNYANNEAARAFLDGEIEREEAVAWLRDFLLYSEERAQQRLRFVETYRSYVINYNYGKDLSRIWLDAQASSNSDRRWTAFTQLLAFPPITSEMEAYRVSQAAIDLAQDAVIVDTHVDVPYRLEEAVADALAAGSEADSGWIDVGQATSEGDFDLPRARAGGLDAPFMSIYIPASLETEGGAIEMADTLIDMVERIVAENPDDFVIATTADEVEAAKAAGMIALPMGMENGAPIAGDLANLHHFYDRGIRYITLAHSESNHIADSSYDDARPNGGLSEFGLELVAEMNRLGMMIDISHVSDEAFYDALEVSTAPLIASHSSARAFTPGFERNMSDEMIVALAEAGGVIHINYGSSFITESANAWVVTRSDLRDIERARLEAEGMEAEAVEAAITEWNAAYLAAHPYPFSDIGDVLDHFDHVVDLVGIDHVGIGSDYDGVGNSLPAGLKDVTSYPRLVDGLMARGYDEAAIRKVLGGNTLRVWRDIEAAAAMNDPES
jgi:membrane dipeptidase